MVINEPLSALISRATGRPFAIDHRRAVGGGCINATEVMTGKDGTRYFIKLNNAATLDMFEAEAAGLEEIRLSGSVRAPQPIVTGTAGSQAFLVLEYLDFGGDGKRADAMLGRQLAAMHRHTRPGFGWSRNNTIGTTRQINTEESDWVTFYREHRLRFQLELAKENGNRQLLQRGEALLEVLPVFYRDYRPGPSLLHGDLWGGNHAVLRDGTPVIFDPAVYYGDREADVAMTEMFGGFGSGFHAAYREAWPLDSGYRVRRDLYNLYHVLNHFNLFGGGYAGQAATMIDRLLSNT